MKLGALIWRIGDPGIKDEFCISAKTPLNSEVLSIYLENKLDPESKVFIFPKKEADADQKYLEKSETPISNVSIQYGSSLQ